MTSKSFAPHLSSMSCNVPARCLAEVCKHLAKRGSKSVLDYGCGRLKNATILFEYFKKVYFSDLPEVVESVKKIDDFRTLTRNHAFRGLYELGSIPSNLKVDVLFIINVVHIQETKVGMVRLIQRAKEFLANPGYVVILNPGNDSKYSDLKVGERKKVWHGKAKYTYYWKLNASMLDVLANKADLIFSRSFPADHKYLRLYSRTRNA